MPQPAALLALVLAPSLLAAQGDPGVALWRVAGQTLNAPPALATGASAALWNPAQPAGERVAIGIDAVQGAQEVGATGMFGAARVRVADIGYVSVLYGRMQIGELVRTSSSPAPDPGTITFYTQVIGVGWTRSFGRIILGVTGAAHHSRLDANDSQRWTLDFGAALPLGERIRLAGATHFLSRLDDTDPAQDVYGGVEVVAWRGAAWRDGPPGAFVLRYGTAFAHGFGADHSVGAGFALGDVMTADLLVTYEGAYTDGGWLPVAAVGLAVGKYRVMLAANPGSAGLGPAFRVGLEARFE